MVRQWFGATCEFPSYQTNTHLDERKERHMESESQNHRISRRGILHLGSAALTAGTLAVAAAQQIHSRIITCRTSLTLGEETLNLGRKTPTRCGLLRQTLAVSW